MFGNKEIEQTKTLSIVQTPPTNTAKISGYVYEDTNKNGVKDANEKFVSGWKLELKNIVPQETCNNTQNNNNITLTNGQQVTNKNFGNKNTKKK